MKLRPRSRTQISRRRLGLESLEPRQMLSATVTAVLSGGNLTLTGNKNAAYVEVHETNTGTESFLITGLSGTKISYNGSTGTSETVNGVTGALTVNLPGSGSGTQSFELDSASGGPTTTIAGNLSVTMGNAADTVLLQGGIDIDGSASIATGNGNSVITISATDIGGGLAIATGSGNQTISVGKVENLGGGADVVVDGGAASITTGAGNSTVMVVDTGVYEGALTISLGNGNGKVVVGSEADTFGADVFVGGNLSISLGNGNGTVQIDNTQVDNDLTVHTGNGNANISIGMETGQEETDVFVDGYLYVSSCPGNTTVTVVNTDVGSREENEVRSAFVSQSMLSDGDVAIELAAGNDKVTIGSSTNEFPSDVLFTGNAYVDLATGNATIAVESATIYGNLEISHVSGNTAITIGAYDPFTEEGFDVYVSNVTITTGAGNATIAIGGTAEGDEVGIYGCLKISTGTGNASIGVTDDYIAGNASITDGSGNATVSVLEDYFGSNLSIVLGVGGTSGGSSSVSLRDVFVEGSTTLNGGGNASLYFDGSDDFVGGISYSHFKKVTT